MFILSSYGLAIAFTVITMLCWGSWANTQKLAAKNWRFELFYWDYVIGVVALALIFAFTLGSVGEGGRGFLADIQQADRRLDHAEHGAGEDLAEDGDAFEEEQWQVDRASDLVGGTWLTRNALGCGRGKLSDTQTRPDDDHPEADRGAEVV